VFERPYRDLWPVELKQRWLEENLPVFCPVAAYQVAVRRGDNLLTDAFNQIASADPGELRQGISVTFQEEEGYGPGVTREFFTLVRFAPEGGFDGSHIESRMGILDSECTGGFLGCGQCPLHWLL
jgi:hypothetical protein